MQKIRKFFQYILSRTYIGKYLLPIFEYFAPPGIVILHKGRCGSTVLERMFANHKNFSPFSEIMEPFVKSKRNYTSIENMMRCCRAAAIPKYSMVEIKFMECQHLILEHMKIKEFVAMVEGTKYKKIIFIKRQNFLKGIVSVKVALARGQKWHVGKAEKVSDTKVKVDINKVTIQGKTAPLAEMIEYCEQQHEALESTLKERQLEYLEIVYERDVQHDPYTAYRKICDWIGVPAYPVEISLRRSVTKPLNEIIENWDEIRAALEGTKYEWMLSDEESGGSPGGDQL